MLTYVDMRGSDLGIVTEILQILMDADQNRSTNRTLQAVLLADIATIAVGKRCIMMAGFPDCNICQMLSNANSY